jgi:hypothetical protein
VLNILAVDGGTSGARDRRTKVTLSFFLHDALSAPKILFLISQRRARDYEIIALEMGA